MVLDDIPEMACKEDEILESMRSGHFDLSLDHRLPFDRDHRLGNLRIGRCDAGPFPAGYDYRFHSEKNFSSSMLQRQ